ncbi:MAG: histidinol-phosphate transaminase [Aestuariivita sp.]|nr:histidinol-phosphate transaminase [Aestuariivita sp.]
MLLLKPNSGVMKISPYLGGQSHIDGLSDVLKLSSNENPVGPSPQVVNAIASAASKVHRYPSRNHTTLRERIAELHGLNPDQVIIGVGSDEILTLLALAYADSGTEVVYPEHGFLLYPTIAHIVGAYPIEAKETERCVDISSILDSITPKTRLVYIANPANPSSTMLEEDVIAQLCDSLPTNCLLVLDGAYAEFVEGFDGGAGFVRKYENVVMTRTFSKIYGLGGLRVGWGYASASVIDVLNRIRGPFNMSNIALAGAEAAILDQVYVKKCRDINSQQRMRLCDGFRQLGIKCDKSYTNFVLARFNNKKTADFVNNFLKSQGIIVRDVKAYKMPEALRITVGTPDDNDRVLNSVKLALETTCQ